MPHESCVQVMKEIHLCTCDDGVSIRQDASFYEGNVRLTMHNLNCIILITYFLTREFNVFWSNKVLHIPGDGYN